MQRSPLSSAGARLSSGLGSTNRVIGQAYPFWSEMSADEADQSAGASLLTATGGSDGSTASGFASPAPFALGFTSGFVPPSSGFSGDSVFLGRPRPRRGFPFAFGFELEDFIPGVEIAGAAGFLEFAADADLQLFV